VINAAFAPRENAPSDVDNDVSMFPGLELRSADVDRGAADMTEQHAVIANDEFLSEESTSVTIHRNNLPTDETGWGRALRRSVR
jgi:hypothetical protein